MKNSPTWSLIKLADSLSFPEICQICWRNHAPRTAGFACKHCKNNLQHIKPPWCNLCGLPQTNPSISPDSCRDCIKTKYSFSKARSIFTANHLPREVIHRLKYSRHDFFEPLLREWLLKALQSDLNLQPLAVIPIPLHEHKKRERGFNQSDTIARIFASIVSAPVEYNLLKRVVATESQTHLSRIRRIANVKNAFNCPSPLPSGCFLLVDDVMTTGATADACAKNLMSNGASSVEVLTITRGTHY